MICVDLDCTLIDSERRYGDEMVIAAEYGISEEEYVTAVDTLYRHHGTAGYSFELLYEILAEQSPVLPWKITKDLNALLDRIYLFPDSELFLSSFKPEQLSIITTGNHEFQSRKIAAHNLKKWANYVWITPHKARAVAAESIFGAGGNIFFIDDAPREIEAVKRARPEVICIQVRTPALWEIQRKTEFYDVHLPDLEAVTHYIKGILHASA